MSRSQQRKAPLRCAGLQQCRMENIERTDGDPPLAQMMTPRFIEMCQRIIKHVARQYPARVGKLRQYRAQWRCNRSVARLFGHGEQGPQMPLLLRIKRSDEHTSGLQSLM